MIEVECDRCHHKDSHISDRQTDIEGWETWECKTDGTTMDLCPQCVKILRSPLRQKL